MERPTFELVEMLKEHGNECSNIFRALFSRPLRKGGQKSARRTGAAQLPTTCSPKSAYDQPTPTGWSMKNMLALEFQDSGWYFVVLASTTRQGPMTQYWSRLAQTNEMGTLLALLHE
jgi:hypothetical protein